MAENSKIQWTHHTFNPWRGCARVSPGCIHCYAEALSKRNPKTLGTWGVYGTRVVAVDAYWKQVVKWDKAAAKAGERHRVFCASLADVGEDRIDLLAPRERLSKLILDTPHLDWLLLTKRPENMARLFPNEVLERSWVGTTCENQRYADERIPLLLQTPAAVRFISAEPLLGPINLRSVGTTTCPDCRDALGVTAHGEVSPRLDWVIVGGESGNGAREFDTTFARSIVKQCADARVACFVKQLGAKPQQPSPGAWNSAHREPMALRDRKGGDMSEWPADLRVRQFPNSASGVL